MAKKMKRKKVKKKKWFSILSPKVFGEIPFSETLAKESSDLNGRVIETQLSNVNRDMTKQNIKLKLKIDGLEGEKAHTKITQYELSKSFIQRMVRKRINKIEVINDVKLKDNRNYRIKTVAITLRKCSVSQKKALRKAISEEIKKAVSSFEIGSLIIALSTNKMQREIKNRVSKVYPLRFLDIVKIRLLKEKKDIIRKKRSEPDKLKKTKISDKEKTSED